jgi:hypothetical protein
MQRRERKRAKETGRCKNCRALFIMARKDSQYCSNKCRQEAYRQRSKKANIPLLKDVSPPHP